MASRYAVIIAGGSGTRLWPMSRADQPKQLIPFIGGRSLLRVAADRLDGLIEPAKQLICTGEKFRAAIRSAMPRFTDDHILGEPEGRDTLAAVGLPAAVVAQRDPGAAVAVFTADHLIEPVNIFQQCVARGFEAVEKHPDALVTFGIQPTHPATGYGYIKLGPAAPGLVGVNTAEAFKEKPEHAVAQQYLASDDYRWNSGMFVWRVSTVLDCIQRYEPAVHAALMQIAQAWYTPRRRAVLAEIYPTIKKISVDYALMERAAADPAVGVLTVSMPVTWLDVGSWTAYGQTLTADDHQNRSNTTHAATLDSTGNLIVCDDPKHLIAAIGVENLVIVRTARATLICHRDHVERIKHLHGIVGQRFGAEYL